VEFASTRSMALLPTVMPPVRVVAKLLLRVPRRKTPKWEPAEDAVSVN